MPPRGQYGPAPPATPPPQVGSTNPPNPYADSVERVHISSCLMELQHSMGEVRQAIRALEKVSDKQTERLDTLSGKVDGINKRIYAAAAIAAFVGPALAFAAFRLLPFIAHQ